MISNMLTALGSRQYEIDYIVPACAGTMLLPCDYIYFVEQQVIVC